MPIVRDDQLLQAGECYERALDYDRAIDCYRECGAIDRWLTALERYGHVFEAAQLAIEHGQRPRAIRLLQRVEPTDPDFREACGLLADAFETEGHFDLAAGKLDEHIATFRPSTRPPTPTRVSPALGAGGTSRTCARHARRSPAA